MNHCSVASGGAGTHAACVRQGAGGPGVALSLAGALGDKPVFAVS